MKKSNSVQKYCCYCFSLPLLQSLTPTKDAIGFLTSEFLTHYLKTIDFFFSLGHFF